MTDASRPVILVDARDLVAIERKSLADLVQCVGRERERFEDELRRLEAFPIRSQDPEHIGAVLPRALRALAAAQTMEGPPDAA